MKSGGQPGHEGKTHMMSEQPDETEDMQPKDFMAIHSVTDTAKKNNYSLWGAILAMIELAYQINALFL